MTKTEKIMMSCVIVQFFMFIVIMYRVLVLLAMGHGSAADTVKS